MIAATHNKDLFDLINECHAAFSNGENLKFSALRAKINIKLKKRGHDPMTFWATFKDAAEYYHSTMVPTN